MHSVRDRVQFRTGWLKPVRSGTSFESKESVTDSETFFLSLRPLLLSWVWEWSCFDAYLARTSFS